MLDFPPPHEGAPSRDAAADPFDPRGRSDLDALRLDAGVIHRHLRRIAGEASAGGAPDVADLDRVAEAVQGLHRRILSLAGTAADVPLEDVVAARHEIHRSLALVQEVAEDVLAG